MKQASQLFDRYLRNECTAEEINTLLNYFGEEQENASLKAHILKQLASAAPENFEQQPGVIAAFHQSDQYLQKTLFPETSNRNSFIRNYSRYFIAASITAAILCTAYFFSQHYHQQETKQLNLAIDVQPGSNKAILTLADGSTVALDTNGRQAILGQKGIQISKTKDGTLVYEVSPPTSSSTIPTAYNQLRTPKGAQYQVVLPDGTRVWLNASSSLRYPVAFSQNERRVELTGEGYFEVSKVQKGPRRIPFYVETSSQEVQVLGTEFNISAYEDDQEVKTTLLSGKVNVSNRIGNYHKSLIPGEQAILTAANGFKVIKVNAENVAAWKDGNFLFEDIYLKDILKQFSRWYQVEVDYTGLPETRYNILIPRNESLLSVLHMLEKTGNIKFQFKNNTITLNH